MTTSCLRRREAGALRSLAVGMIQWPRSELLDLMTGVVGVEVVLRLGQKANCPDNRQSMCWIVGHITSLYLVDEINVHLGS